jgi:polyisoprenyl-teichoic acid--peptidoglycan teichoic acid transferase
MPSNTGPAGRSVLDAQRAVVEARRAELAAKLAAAGGRVPAAGPGGAGSGRSRRRRILLVICAVLLVVAGSAVVAGGYLAHRYTGAVHQEPLLGDSAATVPMAAADTDPATPPATGTTRAPAPGKGAGKGAVKGAVNVLLVGVDERSGAPAGAVRSDTIMIAHIPTAHDRVYLISIPRDSRVEIPAYRRTGYAGGTDKVNAAYQYGAQRAGGRAGGFELLGLTLRRLIGIGFNAGAIVNFDGLRSAVDALGGVDMCIDEETTSIHIGWDRATGKPGVPYTLSAPNYDTPRPVPGMRPQVYHVGCRHLAGWEALDYVRQRELIPDGDYGRQRHQQQLIKALGARITEAGMIANPLAADRTLRALGNSVTFDGNGTSLANWILAFRNLKPDAITMIKTNGGRFASRTIGGRSFEILDGTSQELFAALRTDKVAGFVAAHPDWVSTS